MLTAVVLLFLARASFAYEMRCSEHKNRSVIFAPTDDKNIGRYRMEVCMETLPNLREWGIDLMIPLKVHQCNPVEKRKYSETHSMFKAYKGEDDFKQLNCSHVCMTVIFDMIFSSCYEINSLLGGSYTGMPYVTYYDIVNKYTQSYFTGKINTIYNGNKDHATIYFYTLAVPDKYSVEQCPKDTSSKTSLKCINVDKNCTKISSPDGVRCTLSRPGCHTLELRHHAPWTRGVYQNQTTTNYPYCWELSAEVGVVVGAARWVVWAAAAALGGAALGLALCRLRASARFRKQVMRMWLERNNSEVQQAASVTNLDYILLLYAREGDTGQRVVNLLREVLQETCGVKVQDMYSAEWQRNCGADPAGALRTALDPRAPTRLLLLQTPALAALYRTQHTPTHVGAPLLGRRVLYRCPHYADSLLPYALRLLADNAHLHTPYKKYYLATLSELETDVFPQLVPFVRYSLPAALSPLTRDLSPALSPAPALALAPATAPAPADTELKLAAAIQEFVAHVNDHPDYLMDELTVMS